MPRKSAASAAAGPRVRASTMHGLFARLDVDWTPMAEKVDPEGAATVVNAALNWAVHELPGYRLDVVGDSNLTETMTRDLCRLHVFFESPPSQPDGADGARFRLDVTNDGTRPIVVTGRDIRPAEESPAGYRLAPVGFGATLFWLMPGKRVHADIVLRYRALAEDEFGSCSRLLDASRNVHRAWLERPRGETTLDGWTVDVFSNQGFDPIACLTEAVGDRDTADIMGGGGLLGAVADAMRFEMPFEEEPGTGMWFAEVRPRRTVRPPEESAEPFEVGDADFPYVDSYFVALLHWGFRRAGGEYVTRIDKDDMPDFEAAVACDTIDEARDVWRKGCRHVMDVLHAFARAVASAPRAELEDPLEARLASELEGLPEPRPLEEIVRVLPRDAPIENLPQDTVFLLCTRCGSNYKRLVDLSDIHANPLPGTKPRYRWCSSDPEEIERGAVPAPVRNMYGLHAPTRLAHMLEMMGEREREYYSACVFNAHTRRYCCKDFFTSSGLMRRAALAGLDVSA